MDGNLYLSERELIILVRCLTSSENCFKRTFQEFYENLQDGLHQKLDFLDKLHKLYGFQLVFDWPPLKPLLVGGINDPREDVIKSLESIKQNYINKLPLKSNIPNQQPAEMIQFYNNYLSITIVWSEAIKKMIGKQLNNYIKNFMTGKLSYPKKNFMKPENYLHKFVSIIQYYENFSGNNSLFIEPEPVLLETFKDTDLFKHSEMYRFIEYFLLMEDKGYIKIKGIDFDNSKKHFKWNITIDLKYGHREIQRIEAVWLKHRELCFNIETGHAYNGELAQHRFIPNQTPYKMLKIFMENPEARVSFDNIEEYVYGRKKKAKKSVHQKRKTDEKKEQFDKINNLIKGIRTNLKLDSVKSKIKIQGNKDYFILSFIPND